MGLWIRSQDKEILAECNVLIVSPSENNGFYTYADSKGEKVYLGHYSTREKALKVLDEIQYYIGRQRVIFQMPLDSEVE